MPLPTPFHPRTSELCESYAWKEWAGYYAVRSFDTAFEREYNAFRQGAGLIDVTPLYKFDVRGTDAGAFLAFATVKDVRRMKPGQVTYLCWCDANGHVLDDGTITRWSENEYRMTSADPSLAWLQRLARGFDVEIVDVSNRIAALALQGPTARSILANCTEGDVEGLRFFRAMRTRLAGADVEITRTGYTGDLGYEIWVENEQALATWDAVVAAGADHGLLPAGLDAMDITRVEAGFILGGVDYTSARRAMNADQYSTPIEIGLGWAVQLDREPFVGRDALRREAKTGASRALVGLELDWDELEALYDAVDLPPDIPAHAWRESIPVYDGAVQIGYATSGAWSPALKKNLALATVDAAYGRVGQELRMEWTVEHHRKTVKATVVDRPFFDPPRKRSTPR